MKTILKFTIVVALMLSTVVSMASEPKMNLVANSIAKSLIFTLEEVTENMNIQIIDAYDNIIYSEKFTGDTLRKRFDLENLDSGTYYFFTENEFKSYMYTISLDNDKLEILSKEETHKAHFRKTEDKVFVNLLNLDKSKVAIKVYNEDDRLVHSETVVEKIVVEKAFNFTNAYAGSYTIMIEDGINTYTQKFIVN